MAGAESTCWRVYVAAPRKRARERSWRLRVQRRDPGASWIDAYTETTETTDREQAQELARLHELALNGGSVENGAMTLPLIMDARIDDMARDPTKSPESVTAFRYARDKLAEILGGIPAAELDRRALLRAQDKLRGSIGPETVNTYLRRAAACWRWCEERGFVAGQWPRIRPLNKPPSKKRPYTPEEAKAILEWASTYEGGRWRGLLSLIHDTGRRVSEVCKIRERDLDRGGMTVRVTQKGKRTLVLPVSLEVLLLLPERQDPAMWIFRRKKQARTGGGWGPARRDSVLGVIRRGIAALGIVDGERLDTHSLRRSFATDAHRAGLPDDITRRLTGHERPEMLAHYMREAVGDDLRAAQQQVAAYRDSDRPQGAQPASHEPPINEGSEEAETSLRKARSPVSDGASEVRPKRLELQTSASGGQRSIQLSYGRVCVREPYQPASIAQGADREGLV